MSKAALALLAAEDSQPQASASQRAIDLLEGRAAPPPERKKAPSLAMAPVGGAEMLLRGATGMVAGIPAGVAYGGAAVGKALGLGVDPRTTMAKVQEYLTYDPVSESGQAGDELLARGIGRAISPVVRKLDEGATAVGRVSPTAETFLREAPSAAMAAGGVMGLSPFAAPAAEALRAAPGALIAGARNTAEAAGAAGRKIASGAESVSDAAARVAGREVRPPPVIEPEINPVGKQSMGAASVAPDLSSASPELRQAIREAAKKTGGAVDPEVLSRHLEADTLPIPIRYTEGQATRDPDLFSSEVNQRAKHPEFAQRFAEQKQALADNMDEIRREAAPSVVGNDHVQNGQQLIDEFKAYDEPIQADIRAKYKALEEANGGQFPLSGQDFVAAADQALAKKMKGRYVPAEIAGDLAELRDGGPMTFETFENLRTNLAAEARKAERSGDGNAAMAVNIVRDALESLPMTEPSPTGMRLYRATKADETDVHPWSSWTPELETAEAYKNNQGYGGPHVREESLPLNDDDILHVDTSSRRGLADFAEKIGLDREKANEWWDDGKRYPWEGNRAVKQALERSEFKALQYEDDFPSGATTVVPFKPLTLPKSGEQLKALADAARSASRARHERLRYDPAYKAAVEDSTPMGELSPLADKFTEKYIVNAPVAHVQRMQETLGASDTAREIMAAAPLNYIKSKSGIDMYTNRGELSQAGYNKALAQVRPKLALLAGERAAEQAEALGNVARNIIQAPAGAHVNYSNTATALMKEGAKGALEGAANVAAHGVPVGTWTRAALGNRTEKKAVRESLKPGAGLSRLRESGERQPP